MWAQSFAQIFPDWSIGGRAGVERTGGLGCKSCVFHCSRPEIRLDISSLVYHLAQPFQLPPQVLQAEPQTQKDRKSIFIPHPKSYRAWIVWVQIHALLGQRPATLHGILRATSSSVDQMSTGLILRFEKAYQDTRAVPRDWPSHAIVSDGTSSIFLR